MANNNDFSILLKSVLDKSGINTELKQIQEIVNKHSIDIIPSLKSASLRNQMKEVSKSIANDFNKTFGTNLTGNDVYKAYLNQVKQVTKEQERLNALQKKTSLSEQQRYYQKIIENNKTIYSLKNKLLSADEKQTLEINKQLKALEQRNVYNRSQLDKKGLTDNSWERIMNNSKIALENQYKINQAKIQDIENTRTISNIQKQAIEIQRSIGNGTYNTQISQLQAQFKNLGLTQTEVTQKMTAVKTAYQNLTTTGISSEELVKRQQLFNNELLKTSNHLKVLKIEMKDYANSASQFKLSTQIENWLTKNTAATKAAKIELSSYIKELNSGQITAKRFDEISMAFTRIDTNMRSMGKLGKSFTQTLVEGMKKFSYWTSSTFLLMKAFHEIKQGITNVIALDTALVDLKKTATMTNTELEEFYKSSNIVAKQMGVTTQEIINQASAWSRLGYSSAESATEMAKYSSMFATISPGMNIDNATNGLVSIMKAFKIATDDVLDGIMSKINIIGNTQALSNSDIIDFLTRSSSAMAEANNSLEETIALGTAAVEITRDATSVGNMLKTVSMRIRGYDEETESYSENLENLSGVIANLTKTTSSPGGISLFTDDTKKTYKSTYQILKDISEIYNELDDKTQAQLLEALAGKRQGQAVAAIISNFDAAEKSIQSMSQSTGNAEAEMSVVMDSLEYKLNKLSQTGVGISQNLFQREDLKNAVDGLTKVGEVLDFLTNKLGLFGTTMATLGIIGGIKNVGRTKVSVLI